MALDPHINPQSGVWDDNYYATVGKYGSTANSAADQLYRDSAGQEDQYITQLLQQSGNQRDLMLKKLDAEHKLALGNDDGARAQFLESVANKMEDTMGRVPYDYQRYNNRELQQYALGNTAISQNKQLALQKLNNDSQALSQNQGAANQNLAESLNERGVLTGQKPQYNMLNQTGNSGISGISGVGGLAANMQNNQYNNQFGALANQQQGINNDYSQQQNNLDFQHANTTQDLQTNARRDAQDQQNNYLFGTQQANNQFEQQRQALERQRLQDNQTNRINANRQAGIGNNVYGQQ